MTLASGIDIPAEKIREICRRYHVREMAVFGSAARETCIPVPISTSSSSLTRGANPGWEFFELEEELERIFCRKADLGTKRSLKPWIRPQALREALVIYAA